MERRVASSKAELSSLIETSTGNRDGTLTLLSGSEHNIEEFNCRLKSYRRWSSKPVEVSPWWCSRYGWYCVDKDLLQCVGCRKYLSAHLPSAVEDAVLYKKAVDRLRAHLVDAHDPTCTWRSDPTSMQTCAPNISDLDQAFIDFSNRLHSLLDFFPVASEISYLVKAMGFDEKVNDEALGRLMAMLKTPDFIGREDLSKDALVVAFTGWRSDRSCKECIRCDYCLRRLGLWIFRPKIQSETNGTSPDLENSQQQSPKMEKHLDPVGQHHKWCPWVLAAPGLSALFMGSTCNGESDTTTLIPTWLALFRLLETRTLDQSEASEDKNRMTEHFVLARQLLEETVENVEDNSENADVSNLSTEFLTID